MLRIKLIPHAAMRARQRYGIDAHLGTVKRWERAILRGKAKLVSMVPGSSRRIYDVEHGGGDGSDTPIVVRVIFDSDTRRIVTVIRPDWGWSEGGPRR